MAGIRGGTRGEYVGRAVECYWDSYGEWFAGAKEGAVSCTLVASQSWGVAGACLSRLTDHCGRIVAPLCHKMAMMRCTCCAFVG